MTSVRLVPSDWHDRQRRFELLLNDAYTTGTRNGHAIERARADARLDVQTAEQLERSFVQSLWSPVFEYAAAAVVAASGRAEELDLLVGRYAACFSLELSQRNQIQNQFQSDFEA